MQIHPQRTWISADGAVAPAGLRTFAALLLALACCGCLTNIRPTVVGRVLDAPTGRPLPGVAVSIQSVTTSPHPSDPLARSSSDAAGHFICPGAQRLDLWWGYQRFYQLHFHHDGYADASHDFTYPVHGGLAADQMPIGPIRMQPVSLR